MINKKNQSETVLYSNDQTILNLIGILKTNEKKYKRLLDILSMLGDFEMKTEIFMNEMENKKQNDPTCVYCIDKNGCIFTLCILSDNNKDLNIIKKESDFGVVYYDLSLAKKFEITLENVELLKTDKEYGFKFGRIISDNKTFYTLLISDNIGYNIEIKYDNTNNIVSIKNIIEELNKLNSKPTMLDFENIFEQLITKNKIGFTTLKFIAFKEMKKQIEFTIGDSDISLKINNDQPKEKTPSKFSNKSELINEKIEMPKIKQLTTNFKKQIELNTNKKTKKIKTESNGEKEMDSRKIYLDQAGYEKFMQEIEEAKENLIEQQKLKGSAAGDGGDGFHDNFAFEESERRERLLSGLLRDKIEQSKRIVIIDRQQSDDSDLIDINDMVSLTLMFDESNSETDIYLLTGGGSEIGHHDDHIAITVNSPLGSSIYHKTVGETVTYSVNERVFNVKINEKMKQKSRILL